MRHHEETQELAPKQTAITLWQNNYLQLQSLIKLGYQKMKQRQHTNIPILDANCPSNIYNYAHIN